MTSAKSRIAPLALLIAVLALCTGFLLTGCHNNDDQEVRTLLDSKLTINDDDLQSISDELNSHKLLSAYKVELGDYVGTLLQGYTYNIDSIETDGDDAQATVTITARDFSSAISSFGQSMTDNEHTLNKLKKAKKTSELKSTVEGLLSDALSTAGDSTRSSTISVELKRGDDGWELADEQTFLDAWYDAMFGQALDDLEAALK